jgi:creatinine amidohydrolase
VTRPYVLRETTWDVVRSTRYELAVLPWGATEAHNYHLPYATDVYEAEAIAIEAARQAWDTGARVVVLPAIPFGVNTGQLDIPLTINMNPTTQLHVLRDVVDSLSSQGIQKLVIVNGHGGNDFKAIVRELQATHDFLIVTVNWWQIEDARKHFSEPGDHAGALETAVMLHIVPELVVLDKAGKGEARPFRVTGLREGWAWTPRAWTQATVDTGVGDPAGATAEAGERFVAAICARLAQLFSELRDTPIDQLYEP